MTPPHCAHDHSWWLVIEAPGFVPFLLKWLPFCNHKKRWFTRGDTATSKPHLNLTEIRLGRFFLVGYLTGDSALFILGVALTVAYTS